jgi:Phage Mu protein F like protein.|nr:MAG TPA: minor capsid component [Caudoviricetes sp.]
MDAKRFFVNYGGIDKLNYIRTAETISDDMFLFFGEIYTDLKNGDFLTSVPRSDYIDALMDLYVAWASGWLTDDNDDMRKHAESVVNEIMETTEKTISHSKDENFLSLYRSHSPMEDDDIPEAIIAVLGRDRADFIGNNESLFINNYGGFYSAIQDGKESKTWCTCEDDRVRMTHNIVDGETMPIERAFEVGGYYLMFPRDDSMGAPTEETINCRCWLEYS